MLRSRSRHPEPGDCSGVRAVKRYSPWKDTKTSGHRCYPCRLDASFMDKMFPFAFVQRHIIDHIPFPWCLGISIEWWFLSPPSNFGPLCPGSETSICQKLVRFLLFSPLNFRMSPLVHVILARPSGAFYWWMITLLMCTTALNFSGRFKYMKNTEIFRISRAHSNGLTVM